MTDQEIEERARKLYDEDTKLLDHEFGFLDYTDDTWDNANEVTKSLYRRDAKAGR